MSSRRRQAAKIAGQPLMVSVDLDPSSFLISSVVRLPTISDFQISAPVVGGATVSRSWTSYFATLCNKNPDDFRIITYHVNPDYGHLDPIAVVASSCPPASADRSDQCLRHSPEAKRDKWRSRSAIQLCCFLNKLHDTPFLCYFLKAFSAYGSNNLILGIYLLQVNGRNLRPFFLLFFLKDIAYVVELLDFLAFGFSLFLHRYVKINVLSP